MKLNELLKAIQPVQVVGASDIEITGINIEQDICLWPCAARRQTGMPISRLP